MVYSTDIVFSTGMLCSTSMVNSTYHLWIPDLGRFRDYNLKIYAWNSTVGAVWNVEHGTHVEDVQVA